MGVFVPNSQQAWECGGLLSPTRNIKAAKRFLGKVLKKQKAWGIPSSINTDKNPTYATAIKELKKEGRCPEDVIGEVRIINNQFGTYTA